MAKKRFIRIELTPEQQEQVRQVLGRDVTALEMTPEELEERAAPTACSNHPSSTVARASCFSWAPVAGL